MDPVPSGKAAAGHAPRYGAGAGVREAPHDRAEPCAAAVADLTADAYRYGDAGDDTGGEGEMRRRIVAWLAWFPMVVVAAAPAAAAAAPTGPVAAYSGRGFRPPAQQIVCESLQFRRQQCPADTRGGVRLLQQTGGVCTRGATWGYTRQGLWVTNGCRAIFAVVGGAGARPDDDLPSTPTRGRLIVCESWQYRPHRCANVVARRPRIEVIAGTCVEGRTWGWKHSGVWVSGGCRARFLLG